MRKNLIWGSIVTVLLVIGSVVFLEVGLKGSSVLGDQKVEKSTAGAFHEPEGFQKSFSDLSKKNKAIELHNVIKEAGLGKPMQPGDMEKERERQKEEYNEVKDRISITREVAKQIFSDSIKKLFGQVVTIEDQDLNFSGGGDFVTESGKLGGNWMLSKVDEKMGKRYFGWINIEKEIIEGLNCYDTIGTIDTFDAAYPTKMEKNLTVKEEQKYLKMATDFVQQHQLGVLPKKKYEDCYKVEASYIGIRPAVSIRLDMEKYPYEVNLCFYTDSWEPFGLGSNFIKAITK